MVPTYSVSDFVAAARALLPRGRAWTKQPGTVLTNLLSGIAAVMQTAANRASYLLTDAFPSSTDELLPDWEASLGLPDPCAGLAPDIADRRNQVVSRFAGGGGQSIGYFTGFALTLGYVISVIEYAPFRFGFNHFGDPMYGVAWANAWTVRVPTITPTFFQFGLSNFGDAFANWGNTVLQCEFGRFAPAHTVVMFQYS